MYLSTFMILSFIYFCLFFSPFRFVFVSYETDITVTWCSFIITVIIFISFVCWLFAASLSIPVSVSILLNYACFLFLSLVLCLHSKSIFICLNHIWNNAEKCVGYVYLQILKQRSNKLF